MTYPAAGGWFQRSEEEMDKKRIGVLTGGGDCAGLNPAIKWVVKTAVDDRLRQIRKTRYEVLGIRDGWKGLVYLRRRRCVRP
jgi:6-phosphofructokinase